MTPSHRQHLVLPVHLTVVALVFLCSAACGGTQAPASGAHGGTFGNDPSDPLSFLPDTTVGVFRFNPEAVRAHHDAHEQLWESVRCVGMDMFSCMYSGYFGREWPLLRDDNGDMAVRLLRMLVRGAQEESGERTGDGPSFPPPADADWLIAVVLPTDVEQQLSLWLPSPGPLPPDSCLANTSFVRLVLPTSDGAAVRAGVEEACAQALHPDDCREHVLVLPAGDQVIVDVGRAEGCHERATTSLAAHLRGTAAHHLLEDPGNAFAAHIRLDLLSDLHRAFAWQQLNLEWERFGGLAESQLSIPVRAASVLGTLSDPRTQQRLLQSVTLRLRQDQAGIALDLVGVPTSTGASVLEALGTAGAPVTTGLSETLLDLRASAHLPAALDAIAQARRDAGLPLTFLPDGPEPSPLRHYMANSLDSAPAPLLHRLTLMMGVLTDEADLALEELTLMSEEMGIEHPQPASWEGLLPSSLALSIAGGGNEDGLTPPLTAVLGVSNPSPLIDTPLARIREQIEHEGETSARGTGPASEPAPAAVMSPPPEEEEDDESPVTHDETGDVPYAGVPEQDEDELELYVRRQGRPLTTVHADIDSLRLIITTGMETPEGVVGEPEREESPGIRLVLRPWLHPATAGLEPEDSDLHALHPDHWLLTWLSSEHWSTLLLLPGNWPDPHQPVTLSLQHDNGLLVGALRAGDVDPLSLPPEASRVHDNPDRVPACFRQATRWLNFVFEAWWRASPEDRGPLTAEAATLLNEVADSCPAGHEDTAELIRAHGRDWVTWAETAFEE